MAKPSPWDKNSSSMDDMDETSKLLAKLGVGALKSGAISPQEAASHAAAAGLMPANPAPQINAAANADGQSPAIVPPKPAPVKKKLAAAPVPVPPPAPVRQGPMADPVTQKAKGSGLGEKTTASDTSSDTDTSSNTQNDELRSISESSNKLHAALGLSDPELDRVRQNLQKSPEYLDLQNSNDKLENMINMEKNRPSQLDLRPIAATLDSWFGGHQMAGMPAPESAADRAKRILEYQQKQVQDKRDMLKSIVDYTGKSRGGYMDQMAMQKLIDLVGNKTTTGTKSTDTNVQTDQNTADDPQKLVHGGFVNPVTASNQWNQYGREQLKKNDESADQLDEIVSEVASGNPISDQRIPILRAKIDAAGRPNIAEVSMEAGDQAAIERLKNSASKLLSGTMTPHNRVLFLQDIAQIADIQQKTRDTYSSKLINQGRTQYQQNPAQIESAYPKAYRQRFAGTSQTAKMAADHWSTAPGGSGSVAPGAAKGYDGSTALPENATPEQKAMRLQYLQKKAGH